VVITIDGPAGAGKSTVARAVAERLGYAYVDTGSMYRELTAAAMEHGVDPDDADGLAALVGTPPTAPVDLRSEAVSARVSAVSRHPEVRERMRARQRALARDAVLEGRDTGTRVCPDADVKVYLTASIEARADRRAADLGLGAAEVSATIAARDRGDAEQLAPAPDAHTIDTSALTVAEAVDRVLALVEAAS
jgi:cytidylate kinase